MNSRTCPSCQHDVFDDHAGMCPFCGAKMGRGIVSSGSPKNIRIVLVMASLVLVLAGGMVTFLMAEGRSEQERVTVAHGVRPDQRESDQCVENMETVLAVQREFLAVNGRFAVDSKELGEIASEVELRCPATGEVYDMTVQDETVRLVCPTHGIRTN